MSPDKEALQTLEPIGYMAWNLKTNSPAAGTRRFKVWSSVSEAERHCYNDFCRVVPIYADLDKAHG